MSTLAQCRQCDAGSYCATAALAAPSGACSAGYACFINATVATPTDNTTGALCAAGAYCPVGSASFTPCGPGTFNNRTGATQLSDCKACTPGFTCPNTGTVSPSRPCDAGFACPGGIAVVSASEVCPVGSACPQGSSTPQPCASGTYANVTGLAACTTCPAGFYCVAGAVSPVVCPAGSVCSTGTQSATQALCPIGTYSNQTGLTTTSQCTPCDGGSYCATAGLTAPTGLCAAGYYCLRSANTSTPAEGAANGYTCSVGASSLSVANTPVTGDVCPLGHWCGVGSSAPTPCVPGTWLNTTRATNATACEPCTPGWTCPSYATAVPLVRCPASYVCYGGNVDGTETPCPAGSYCSGSNAVPVACAAGTYADVPGLAACKGCPARSYCSGATVTPAACNAGYYCPVDTTSASQYPCPASTFSNTASLAAASECTNCTAGSWCGSAGLTAPSGSCSAGYACFAKASLPNPTDNTTGALCAAGAYCPAGSAGYTRCPVGTFANTSGNTQLSDCMACTPGFTCPNTGTVSPSRPCDAGYACPGGIAVVSASEVCPVGSACPQGSSTPQPCASGTYANVTGLAVCTTCPAGFYCVAGAVSPVVCPAGSVCASGTQSATQALCPIGTYSNQTGLTTTGQCTPCDGGSYCATAGLTAPTGLCAAGYYCLRSANTSTPAEGAANGYTCSVGASSLSVANTPVTGDVCPLGHWCGVGSSAPTPCVPGTWLNTTRATNATACEPCTPGWTCPSYATAVPLVRCPASYVCYGGNVDGTETPCPAGSFCSGSNAVPVACAAGTYADVPGLAACKSCPARSYCSGATVTPAACDPGFYCPVDTTSASQYPCPASTFSNTASLAAASECTNCTAGSWCGSAGLTAPSGSCSAGYACFAKASLPNPTDNTTGALCAAGAYCPAGSAGYTRCPVGTFANTSGNTQLSDCMACTPGFTCPNTGTVSPSRPCDAGYACPGGIAVVSASEVCPVGSACPQGSSTPQPCASGTYANVTGLAACTTCPAGFYCVAGAVSPVVCPAGSVCSAGTQSATQALCPIGTYSNQTGLTTTSQCTPCDGGSYCATAGLTAPTGLCAAGYYCLRSANTSTPAEGAANGYTCSVGASSLSVANTPVTGDVCPLGHWCGVGSSAPTPCVPGTWLNTTRATDATACEPCTPGWTCPSYATAVPLVRCPASYVCYGGNVDGTETPCPAGSFCSGSNAVPVACAAGTYADVPGLAACKSCPARSYCSGATVTPAACEPGYYCPVDTTSASQYPCPASTFSNATGLAAASECATCTTGWACEVPGLTAPSSRCDAGYVCTGGAAATVPDLGVTGYECPEGSFCLQGAVAPTPCPPGTFSNSTGNPSVASCQPCTPGFVCSGSGIVTPSQLCDAGFVCPAGTAAASQLCPSGYQCAAGTASPQLCDAGTFANQSGLAVCLPCPAAYFCGMGTVNPVACPPGSWCPSGTQQPGQYLCPLGTYSNRTLLASAGECTPCDYGTYCGAPGLTAPSGPCGPGHYCLLGATGPQPSDGATGDECDPGFVCGYGSAVPNPVPAPNATLAVGRPCLPGTFCGAGSSAEAGCPPGTYQWSSGSSSCAPCPPGFMCAGNTSVPVLCPLRHFCPLGTAAPQACANGTFGANAGLATQAECTSCPPTVYCTDGSISGLCAAGYVCIINNGRPDPGADVPPEYGHPCPSGFFCLNGTAVPEPCSNGTFSASIGATGPGACGPCPAGYTCVDGNPVPTPCARGSYCPGNGVVVACPRYSYNAMLAATSVADCLPCPAGTWCNATGIANPSPQYNCPVGSFCGVGAQAPAACWAGTYRDVRGAGAATECATCPPSYMCGTGTVTPTPCPAAAFCAGGSSNATQCPARFYCPALTAVPTQCPASHYCEPGSSQPTLCPLGSYCPAGSAWPIFCPAGTFSPADTDMASRASRDAACIRCPAGTYSAGVDGRECLPCEPGYVCLGGTTSAEPLDVATDNGYACQPGYYCPEGSSAPKACPPGTFNSLDRRSGVDDCLPCYNNTYSYEPAAAACRPCSASAFTRGTGSTACECRGLYRSFQMSDGFCVCAPGYQFLDADMAVLSEADGDVDCQPMQFEWCAAGQRRAASGVCLDVDCGAECGSGSGSWNAAMGLCMCDGLAPLADVCDAACRAGATQVSIDPVTRRATVTDPATNVSTVLDPAADIPGFVGSLSCITPAQTVAYTQAGGSSAAAAALLASPGVAGDGTGCGLYSMDLSTEAGFLGVFNAPAAFLAAAAAAGNSTSGGRRRLAHEAHTSSSAASAALAARRRQAVYAALARELGGLPSQAEAALALSRAAADAAGADDGLMAGPGPAIGLPPGARSAAATGSTAPPLPGAALVQPVTCIALGESLVWTLSSGKGVYPVYVKDSFLNTNADFDYGAFRALASLAKSNSSEVTSFGFTFTQNGTYVFASSVDATAQAIVVVMGPGQLCPTEAAFVPMSADHLVSLGVAEAGSPVLQPNWRLIGSLLAGLTAFAVVVIAGLVFFRRRAWGDTSAYRRRRKAALMGESKFSSAWQVSAADDGGAQRAKAKSKGKAAGAGSGGKGWRWPWQLDADGDEAGDEGASGGARGDGRRRARSAGAGSGAAAGVGGATAPRMGRDLEAQGSRRRMTAGGGGGGADGGDADYDDDGALALGGGPRVDTDDLDLAELIERLKAHEAGVAAAFKAQRDAANRILAALREEAEGLRRMIAAGALGAASAALAAPAPAADAARRAAVLRQIEAELAARALHDRHMARREADILAALGDVHVLLRGDPAGVAAEVLGQLMAAAGDELAAETGGAAGADGADMGAYLAANRRVRPDASGTGESVRAAVARARDLIMAAAGAVADERARRSQGVPLWKSRRGCGPDRVGARRGTCTGCARGRRGAAGRRAVGAAGGAAGVRGGRGRPAA
jgi:hypothetical protein